MSADETDKRTFATPAYLKEVEHGTYQLFRSIMCEERDPRTGRIHKEKLREMRTRPEAYREATPEEEDKVVLTTAHPQTGRVLRLVVIE